MIPKTHMDGNVSLFEASPVWILDLFYFKGPTELYRHKMEYRINACFLLNIVIKNTNNNRRIFI